MCGTSWHVNLHVCAQSNMAHLKYECTHIAYLIFACAQQHGAPQVRPGPAHQPPPDPGGRIRSRQVSGGGGGEGGMSGVHGWGGYGGRRGFEGGSALGRRVEGGKGGRMERGQAASQMGPLLWMRTQRWHCWSCFSDGPSVQLATHAWVLSHTLHTPYSTLMHGQVDGLQPASGRGERRRPGA